MIVRLIWYAGLLSQLALIVYLVRSELYKSNRILFGYNLVAVARTAILLPYDPHTWSYAQLWGWTEPPLIAIQAAFAFMFARDIQRVFKGSRGFVKWFLISAAGLGVLASATALPLEMRAIRWDMPYTVPLVIAVKRVAACGLAALFTAMWVGLRILRPRMPRNWYRISAVASVYYAVPAIFLVTRYFYSPFGAPEWSANVMGVSAMMCFLSLLGMDRAGERWPITGVATRSESSAIKARINELDDLLSGLAHEALATKRAPGWMLSAIGRTSRR